MAYTLAITFEIADTDTGETISTQQGTERFETRTEAEQTAAAYREAIDRRRGNTGAGKLTEISFLSDEWTQGELATLKMGQKLCHREIYTDPNTGEMYVNFGKARYYKSDFDAAAITRLKQSAEALKEAIAERQPAADLMQPQDADSGSGAEDMQQ